MNDKIDIIIPWVDGSDSKWLDMKQKYYNEKNYDIGANSNNRYQDWGTLKYIFRGIEKFLPWVNKVFLVTCGQVPDFLNVDAPKLKLVFHNEYIPEEYLPTFNSNVIELNYHRIDGLSENFILINDDMFFLSSLPEEYFFIDNMVCDEAIETPAFMKPGIMERWVNVVRYNNMSIINKYFTKSEVVTQNYDKWFWKGYEELLERNKVMAYWNDFVFFRNPHLPGSFKKSVLSHLWELEPDVFTNCSKNRFRDYTDVSQFLVRYWTLCEGNFIPHKTSGKTFSVTMTNYMDIVEIISSSAIPMICINEYCTPKEFSIIRNEIQKAFEKILPDKCSFEK